MRTAWHHDGPFGTIALCHHPTGMADTTLIKALSHTVQGNADSLYLPYAQISQLRIALAKNVSGLFNELSPKAKTESEMPFTQSSFG